MTETDDRHWHPAIGLDPDIGDDTHDVEPETYARVHPHRDGTATLDEGWGSAFIETDTLLTLEGWR